MAQVTYEGSASSSTWAWSRVDQTACKLNCLQRQFCSNCAAQQWCADAVLVQLHCYPYYCVLLPLHFDCKILISILLGPKREMLLGGSYPHCRGSYGYAKYRKPFAPGFNTARCFRGF